MFGNEVERTAMRADFNVLAMGRLADLAGLSRV
jgi:hypothetical protein